MASATTAPSERSGKSINHVSRACSNCQRGHVGCDTKRPCGRCVKSGRADTCVDGEQRKRGWRKGRARNPANAAAAASGTPDWSGSQSPASNEMSASPPVSPADRAAEKARLNATVASDTDGRPSAAVLAAQAVLSLQSPQPSQDRSITIAGAMPSHPGYPPVGQAYHSPHGPLYAVSPNGNLAPVQIAPAYGGGVLPPIFVTAEPAVRLPPLTGANGNGGSPPSLESSGSSSRESLPSLSSISREALHPGVMAQQAQQAQQGYDATTAIGSPPFNGATAVVLPQSPFAGISTISSPSMFAGQPPGPSLAPTAAAQAPVPAPSSSSDSLTRNNQLSLTLRVTLNAPIVVLACEGALTEITGLHPEDILGTSVTDLVHPVDASLVTRVLELAQQVPEEPFATVVRIRRPDSKTGAPNFMWMEVSGQIHVNKATGRPVYATVVGHPLQLSNAPGAVDEFSMRHSVKGGGCVEVSPSVATILGHDPIALRSSDVFAIAHPNDQQVMKMALSKLMLGQTPECHLRMRLAATDGTYKWFEANAKAVSGPLEDEPDWITCTFKLLGNDTADGAMQPGIMCLNPNNNQH